MASPSSLVLCADRCNVVPRRSSICHIGSVLDDWVIDPASALSDLSNFSVNFHNPVPRWDALGDPTFPMGRERGPTIPNNTRMRMMAIQQVERHGKC
jgi:hypothetical protein